MKAVVWHGRDDVRVENVAEARPPDSGEIRARVEWCGICGTDIEEWRRGPVWIPADEPHPITGRRAPLILGHEIAARVVDVGDSVGGFSEGDLVAIEGLYGCGKCWWCLRHQANLCPNLADVGLHFDGGLAELVTLPAAVCAVVPVGVLSEDAALAEPVSVAIRAVRRSRLSLGESAAVFGAGMIGLATVVAAKAAGASPVVVIEPDARRRELALGLGATQAFGPEEGRWLDSLRDLTGGRGPDVCVDAAGTRGTGPAAVAASRRGGRTVIVGLANEASSLMFSSIAAGEKEVLGSLAHVIDEDFTPAIRLIASGAISAGAVDAAKVPLERAVDDGFRALTSPEPPPKVLVGPPTG
ncbi:MAG: alcohol dehydrogenase catalytic domain-containing protein [Actinobacteria bacterium]|nr:alcohol dehydrogenase catalytic domain-containing protein [Actinomycetota bacterium]